MKSRSAPRMAFMFVLLACAGGVLWWHREPLISWYYLQNLAGANSENRNIWAERVAGLDARVVPKLIRLLREPDPDVCANVEAALSALAKRWGMSDSRTAQAGEELVHSFVSLSPPGQEAVLEWFVVVLRETKSRGNKSEGACESASHLLTIAEKVQNKGVRVHTLTLAEALLSVDTERPKQLNLCRELAWEAMAHSGPEVRSGGVRLVMHPALNKDTELLARAAPLMGDSSPEVRQAAILTLGLAEETVGVEALLPLLHDPDAEVRRLCEAALRGRGLGDKHVTLAKLISDDFAGQRLQVVRHLDGAEDIDSTVWLMHLSRDASPAVRAAAIRFAANDRTAALAFRQRMLEMAQSDPSPTVRQLAGFYLTKSQKR